MASVQISKKRAGDHEDNNEDSENDFGKRSSALGPPSTSSVGAASRSANAAGGANATDKERKIGHRRVDEAGQISYKKIQTNQLMQSIQLGIQYSIGAMSKFDERDLLMQDFMTVETVSFPKGGSQTTPAHACSDFTFRTVAPLAFRYFLNLFGIRREDYMMSICNEPMRELSNPGASGSIFYLTNDDEFILKTVQHKEAEFLQKLLPGYYMNLNQNPHTLLPKFFGMYCYQCNQKNIRLTVMNNLLPSNVKMHLKFDLKGSTYKRKANKHERAKKSPTFKDLDFVRILPEGVLLEPETYNALISTLRRDCRVLESFRIMDYSLLVGIHNLDQASREEADSSGNNSPVKEVRNSRFSGAAAAVPSIGTIGQAAFTKQQSQQKTKLVAHSTAMESIQAQTEPIDEQEHLPPGGIPARNHKGERLLLFLGIIDILQSYRMRKKLEHTFKSIIHDGDTVSVHRPGFYAHRFLDFMADKVFKKIPSPLKHSPSRKSKRDSVKKTSTTSASEDPRANSEASTSHTAGGGSSSASGTEYFAEGVRHPSQPDVVPSAPLSEKSRPRNRLHESVKQTNPDGGSRSDSRLSGSGEHGTPSRLSVGAGSLGWNTPTPTWTEGTPSFTESTYSGELGNTPIRSSLGASRDNVVTTRNYKDTPYHETEI